MSAVSKIHSSSFWSIDIFTVSKACLRAEIEQSLEEKLFKYIFQVVIYDLEVSMELMRFPLLSVIETSLW